MPDGDAAGLDASIRDPRQRLGERRLEGDGLGRVEFDQGIMGRLSHGCIDRGAGCVRSHAQVGCADRFDGVEGIVHGRAGHGEGTAGQDRPKLLRGGRAVIDRVGLEHDRVPLQDRIDR